MSTRRPPGRSTRRACANTWAGSRTEHRVKVSTTVSNTSYSAPAQAPSSSIGTKVPTSSSLSARGSISSWNFSPEPSAAAVSRNSAMASLRWLFLNGGNELLEALLGEELRRDGQDLLPALAHPAEVIVRSPSGDARTGWSLTLPPPREGTRGARTPGTTRPWRPVLTIANLSRMSRRQEILGRAAELFAERLLLSVLVLVVVVVGAE